MKIRILFIVFVLSLFNVLLYGQSDPPTNYFEIITRTTGYFPLYNTVKFWMETSEPVWDQDHTFYTQDPQALISGLDYATATYINDYDVVDIPIPNNSDNYGLWHVLTDWYIEDHTYGYGIYKFKIGFEFNDPIISFTLDMRDCDYSDKYTSNDTWIEFNATHLNARIDWNNDNFTDKVTNVVNNATYKFWIEKNKSERNNIQNTDYFELLLTLTNQNGHPHLEWNPYHTSVTGYYVHKKLTTESGTRTTEHYTTSTNWTDNDFTIGHPKFTNDQVEYWITAKLSPTQQSLGGNHVKKYGTSWIQWKISSKEESITEYKLKQSYPNPFNPTTTIEYSLPEKGYTVLNIYNTLGQVVARLVDEFKPAGNYSVEFDASSASGGLPSGVYFYNLKSGDYFDVKKMILMK